MRVHSRSPHSATSTAATGGRIRSTDVETVMALYVLRGEDKYHTSGGHNTTDNTSNPNTNSTANGIATIW
jgi:hypothetical protein